LPNHYRLFWRRRFSNFSIQTVNDHILHSQRQRPLPQRFDPTRTTPSWRSLYSGHPLQIEVPEPLEYTLAVHPNYEDEDEGVIVSPSNPKVLMNAAAFPVMRKDLLALLQNEGATLETFEAHLIDEINNVVHTNYVAFNVVGFIAELDPPYMRTFSRPTQCRQSHEDVSPRRMQWRNTCRTITQSSDRSLWY